MASLSCRLPNEKQTHCACSTESNGEAAKCSPQFQWRRYKSYQHEAISTFRSVQHSLYREMSEVKLVD
jgi:hypothetical protein